MYMHLQLRFMDVILLSYEYTFSFQTIYPAAKLTLANTCVSLCGEKRKTRGKPSVFAKRDSSSMKMMRPSANVSDSVNMIISM